MPGTPMLSDFQLAALRSDLQGWTVQAIVALLGPAANAALHREQRLPALSACRRSDSTVAVLTRLFILGDEVTAHEAESVLPNLGLAAALECGLLTANTESTGPTANTEGTGDTADREGPGDAATKTTVRTTVEVRPFEDAWLVSDLGQTATGRPLPPDHVLGAGGASLSLARMTVRREGERVLDVGTGGGVQAMLAARHARSVLATDISTRALDLAALTLALAGHSPGRDGIELRQGSMLQPAAGQKFDLIVSNPPFVITPDLVRAGGLMEYRDGGQRGDDLIAALTRNVATLLAPGGIAQFLGNWEHTAGQEWSERVVSWIPEGVDAWIVQREVLDPAHYVETWLRDGGLTPDAHREAYEAAFAAWLADFTARGVSALGMGSITLRRPTTEGAPTWQRIEDVPSHSDQPDQLGAHIAGVLQGVDAIRAMGEADLAQLRLRVADDVTEERHHRPGAPDPTVIVLRQGGGYGRTRRLDTLEAGFVGACDGELTLGQIAGALAALLEVDEADVRAHLTALTRDLLAEGFVTLA